MTDVVDTNDGPRATGQVQLEIELPDASTWRSAGVVVIDVPAGVNADKVEGAKIKRCRGEAQLTATVTDTIRGVDIYSIRLDPTEIRIRVGNRWITDPTTLGFNSSASGDPNV